jgi:hypothetical protein
MRMSDDRTTKRVFIARPEGKRGIGRPKMRWRDSVDQDAEALGQWCATSVPRHTGVPPRPSRCVTKFFTSHYNYNYNEINNCSSCFLLCLSFYFLYYSRADRGQTRSTKWNWKVTHPSPPLPPQYAKWDWCAAMTLRQYLVCRECRKVVQHFSRRKELEEIVYE